MNIAPIDSIPIPETRGAAGFSSGSGFADAMTAAIEEVDAGRRSSRSAAMDLLAGGKGDVHNIALATQKAELTLELFLQVRNKVVQAFQEVMKMPM